MTSPMLLGSWAQGEIPVAGLGPAIHVFPYCPQLGAQKAWVAGPSPATGGIATRGVDCHRICVEFGRK